MHEANSEDMHFLMPNPFNAILTAYLQMAGGLLVHFVNMSYNAVRIQSVANIV